MYLNIAVKTSYLKVEKKLMIEIFENETISLMQNLTPLNANFEQCCITEAKFCQYSTICTSLHNYA